MPNPDSKSIRVTILGREYPLRVAPADEAYTLHLASTVNERLTRLRNNIPTHPDLTHAVIGALDSAEVVWVARPTWHQWTEGVGLLREALWPGALQLHSTGLGTARVAPEAPRAPVSAELLGYPEESAGG